MRDHQPVTSTSVAEQTSDGTQDETTRLKATDAVSEEEPRGCCGRRGAQEEEKKEGDEDQSPDGIARIQSEIGGRHSWLKWCGHVVALLAGTVMPAFAILFNEVLTALTDPKLLADSAKLRQRALENLVYFIVAGVGALITNFLLFAVWGTYGARIGVEVREMYFDALLKQEIGYYDEKTSAVLNSKLVSDCKTIQVAMGSKAGFALQQLWSFILGFGVAFYYSWRMTLILIACLPALILVGVLQGLALGGAADAEADPFTDSSAFSQELILNVRTVYAFPQLIIDKVEKFGALLETILPIAKKRAWVLGLGMGAIFFALFGIVYSVGLWYGAFLHSQTPSLITIGDMFGCFFGFVMAGMGLGQMGSVAGDVTAGRIGANSFWRLYERKPKIKTVEEPIKKRIEGNITFNHVSFSYPVSPDVPVLKSLSFELKAGSTMAIVGPSGSGKSTIVNLLERFYDPAKGEVLVDGVPIENYDLENLRGQIGLVSQMPLLFDESIADNISAGTDVTMEQIEEAARLANAHEFIMEQPQGYDTRVGEMGGRLSGGQKQRIAIARAMVNRPVILLLDEATSALDTKSEREVQAALDKIAAQKSQTIIVIAHRLSTIRDADNILVLVNGELDAMGPHDALMREDGVYAALVRSQDLITQHRKAKV